MRILSVDEIPDEWKIQLNPTGLGRYQLFAEEIRNTSFVSGKSSKGAMSILSGVRGPNFPYKDLRIGKPTQKHWKRLNRPTYMGVLIQDGDGVVQLVEGILDMNLIPRNMDDTLLQL